MRCDAEAGVEFDGFPFTRMINNCAGSCEQSDDFKCLLWVNVRGPAKFSSSLWSFEGKCKKNSISGVTAEKSRKSLEHGSFRTRSSIYNKMTWFRAPKERPENKSWLIQAPISQADKAFCVEVRTVEDLSTSQSLRVCFTGLGFRKAAHF